MIFHNILAFDFLIKLAILRVKIYIKYCVYHHNFVQDTRMGSRLLELLMFA